MVNPGIKDSESGYAIFLIAGKEYGINIKILASIIDPLEDYSPRYSLDIGKGALRINNEEIPFINIYDLFNLKSPPQSKDTRIIIINIEEQLAAFYVEKIKVFIFADAKEPVLLEPVLKPDQPLVEWKIKWFDRYILLPDFDKILAEMV